MNIPTSLIVVLLVAAWIVVLVPMVAKRRERVPQSEADGTRVLGRATASLRRRPKGLKRTSEGQEDPVSDSRDEQAPAGAGADGADEPADAAEEWAAVRAEHRTGTAVLEADPDRDDDGTDEAWDNAAGEPGDVAEAAVDHAPDADDEADESTTAAARPDDDPALFAPEFAPEDAADDAADDRTAAGPAAGRAPAPDEYDRQEWESAQPRAGWDEGSGDDADRTVRDEELRPVPRRAGRGGFDPEAAEATRAYKYRQRRRITLLLLVATVAFGVAAPLSGVQGLWVGVAVSFLLLVAYLSYLRRQVRIENAIRQRRMERLQRARQIRPEYGPARRGHLAARGREVVALDDDDPSFDDLDEYEPIQYRRAV